jgi:hypothetical protein
MSTPTSAGLPAFLTADTAIADVPILLGHLSTTRNDMTIDLTGSGPIFPEVTVAFPDSSLPVEDRADSVMHALMAYLHEHRLPGGQIVSINNAVMRTVTDAADLGRWVVLDETPVPVSEREFRNPGTHATHCCLRHGCKYGPSRDCAVLAGAVEQEYPCDQCGAPEDVPALQIVRLRQAVEYATAARTGGTPNPDAYRTLLAAAQAIIDSVGTPGKFDDYTGYTGY